MYNISNLEDWQISYVLGEHRNKNKDCVIRSLCVIMCVLRHVLQLIALVNDI